SQYPRYLKALDTRLARLSGQYAKDSQYTQRLAALLEPLQEVLARRPNLLADCPHAEQYRWMLEEFRVSLFAQGLGTRLPVSQKRLEARWTEVEEWLRANPQ
ncbi:MAG: DUF3418 domain-containing protein, partial [Halioglobus sp.]|nr:DUF3418 domain-containing protein [Halioglobus sp.]